MLLPVLPLNSETVTQVQGPAPPAGHLRGLERCKRNETGGKRRSPARAMATTA